MRRKFGAANEATSPRVVEYGQCPLKHSLLGTRNSDTYAVGNCVSGAVQLPLSEVLSLHSGDKLGQRRCLRSVHRSTRS